MEKLSDENMELLKVYLWTKVHFCLNEFDFRESILKNQMIMTYHKKIKENIKDENILNNLEKISTDIYMKMSKLSKHQQNFKRFQVLLAEGIA